MDATRRRLARPAAVALMVLSALLTLIAQGGGASVVGTVGSDRPPVVPAVRPPMSAGTAAITGVVVDADTRAPVAGAIVYLADDGRFPVPVQSRQLTDAKGRFGFVDVPAGSRFTLSASKSGYLDGGFSRSGSASAGSAPMAVRDGEWVSDVRVTLRRPAALAGIVLDEHGDPVVGVFVRVLSRIRFQSEDVLVAGPMTTTDDRGAYRVGGLMPGRYVVQVPSVQATFPATVAASGPAAANAAAPSDPAIDLDATSRLALRSFPSPLPPGGAQALAYPMTFAPAASTIAAATTMNLAFGEERSGVDVSLTPVPVWRVSGVVQGPGDALANLTLRLLPEGLGRLGQSGEAATALVGGDGRFTFANVPAGVYTLDAPRTVDELITSGDALQPGALTLPTPPGRSGWSRMTTTLDSGPTFSTTNFRGRSPNYWGRMSITVGGHDETDVVVVMRPAGSFAGRVTIDPDPAHAPPQMSPAVVIHLESADGDPTLGWLRPESISGAPATELKILGLQPGRYVLRAGADWLVKSVRWNGQDHTDAPFDAEATQDFDGVDVVVTAAAGTIAGVVRDAQGAPAEGARLVVFPTDARLREHDGLSRPRVKSALTTSAGTYRITPLPAGDYDVVAIDAASSASWSDAEFLANVERLATHVSIAWGETKTIDLAVNRLR
jgi:hypothetical protein